MSTSFEALTRGGSAGPDRARRIDPPKRRWLTRLGLPGGMLAAAGGLLLFTGWDALAPATPVRVTPVVVKAVERGAEPAGSVVVQAAGWLEPDPHPYYASALTDGVVEAVLVLEGASVEAGQVVARLVADDARLALERAEAEVEMGRAALSMARAQLDAAEAIAHELVDRRAAMAAASSTVHERRREAAEARAVARAAASRLALLEDEVARKRGLVEPGAVARADFVRLELERDAQRAAVDAATARVPVIEARLATAEAELTRAERHMELLIEERRDVALAQAGVDGAAGGLREAEARRDEAALRVERTAVRAPVDGVVMARLVSPGSKLIRGGDTPHSAHAVHLYRPDELQVRVDVPLADAAGVGVGQPAQVIVEVLPDAVFQGVVTRVVHEADIQKNTVEVKVRIEDPVEALKPEMLARVRFLGRGGAPAGAGADAGIRQRVFAPRSMVTGAAGAAGAAMVVEARREGRGRLGERRIELGPTEVDGWVEVAAGLSAGDLLVDPAAGLRPGTRVRIVGETTAARGGG